MREQFIILLQIAMMLAKDGKSGNIDFLNASIEDLVNLMNSTEPNLVAHAKNNIQDLVDYNFDFLKKKIYHEYD